MSERDIERDLRTLLTHARQYEREESTQGQQETDERRRAWHDGRASAYQDITHQLQALLEAPRSEGPDDALGSS